MTTMYEAARSTITSTFPEDDAYYRIKAIAYLKRDGNSDYYDTVINVIKSDLGNYYKMIVLKNLGKEIQK